MMAKAIEQRRVLAARAITADAHIYSLRICERYRDSRGNVPWFASMMASSHVTMCGALAVQVLLAEPIKRGADCER